MEKKRAVPSEPRLSAERRREVLDIAVECGVALRRSTAKNGIVQASDFLNGMLFAAILLEKNLPAGRDDPATFREIFLEEHEAHRADFASGRYDEHIAAVGPVFIGTVDQTRSDIVFTAGASAESVMAQVAIDYDLDRDEILLAMATILFMVIWGNSRENLDEALEALRTDVEYKIDVFELMVPSDKEIFGEEIGEELQDLKRRLQ